MARLSRLAIDQQLHLLQHDAADDRAILEQEADRRDLLAALFEVSRATEVAIHAYVLLPSQLRLLLTPRRGADLAPMMQRLGRRFAGCYNQRHGVSGSPWAGRYKTGVLQPSRFLLEAMRLVEWQPVWMGLVARPEDWPASSAAHHLGVRADRLVTDHPDFWALGNTPFEREIAYRRFCDTPPLDEVVRQMENATVRGWAMGDAAFIDQLSALQARRLLPARRGRPRREPPEHVSDPN